MKKGTRVKGDPQGREEKKILPEFITEEEVCKKFRINSRQLKYLRLELGLPYFQLTERTRLYIEKDLAEYLKARSGPQRNRGKKKE